MTKILLSVLCFFALSTFSAFAVNDIAIIDIKRVAVESSAGKSIDDQIAQINNASKKELLNLEDKIKLLESNKKNESDSRKIEDLQIVLFDMIRKKRYEIMEAYKIAITSLNQQIRNVVIELAKKRKVRMVMASDAVVYANEECNDFTDEAIKMINKDCTKIPVIVNENANTTTTQNIR